MTPTQTGDKPMVTPELLPCPFCGGDEFLILSNTLIGEHSFWGVECGCHVFGPTATLRAEAIAAWNTRAQETLSPEQAIDVERTFALGQRVGKIKGSNWQGRVVGFYSTALTPVGYAVESEREPGSVQIYPESALAALAPEQPLDALQRLGQEFEQPTPTSRYYFCTADKTWYAKPCGDPWCRDANYQPKQGECNR